LIPRALIPNKPTYKCNPTETKELQTQVYELIDRGHVRESMSLYLVLALLVPKKYSSWRMCVANRAINNITVKYRYSIPRLNNMSNELHVSKVFSRTDIRSGYH